MKTFYVTAAFCCLLQATLAQTPLSSYSISNDVVNTITSYSNQGWTIGADYDNGTTYTNTYAQTNSGGNGLERRVTSFNIGGATYVPVPTPSGFPFDQVIVNRHPLMPGDTINTLYEYTTSTGNNLFYAPRYAGSLESVINSYVCNRGSDNTFSNSPSTQANIERIDLVVNTGILCTFPSSQGFLINERNGNDAFKVAAITSLTGGNTINTLGTLTSVAIANWGAVGPSFVSRVMSRRTGSDVNLRPKQDIGMQTIAGVYISFASLGIAPGTRVYGLSVFPNDVTSSMDLISLTDVPTNTNSSSDGGLDMMAGGGFFVEATLLPLKLQGFNGKIQKADIALQWTYKDDNDLNYFDVERALSNDKPFSTIGRVAVKHAATELYHFTDVQAKAANGNPYLYRIKMVDKDNNFSYSPVIMLRFSGGPNISLYPSVVDQGTAVSLAIAGENNIPCTVDVFNTNGVAVLRKMQHQGTLETINTALLSRGLYVVTVKIAKQIQTLHFVVQ